MVVRLRGGCMMKTLALALGAGGARGLSHVAVFEALDELGVKPVAIAGSSIGALAGAIYGAGMSGKEIRHYIIELAHNRGEVWRRAMQSRAGTVGGMFNGDFSSAVQLDPEKLLGQFLRDPVPDDFGALKIPLTVVASDLYARRAVTFGAGPLRPALAASIAIPGLMRPVVVGDRVLIDGGATNPLPFDLLRGKADIIVAVDITGQPAEDRKDVPSAVETLYAAVQLMTSTIISEKLRHDAPDLLVTPNVGSFRALDFFQASAILRAAEAAKTELKEKLAALLGI
jgi:NTE family protein